jgi:hypothetical protein
MTITVNSDCGQMFILCLFILWPCDDFSFFVSSYEKVLRKYVCLLPFMGIHKYSSVDQKRE